MNVACPACPAKYAVPDEKVRGKKARITCKRCGSAIIIDGTSVGQASKPPAKPRPEPLPPPPAAMKLEEPAQAEWLVAITDERQEPATTERIVSLYASGVIDAETFIWRDGMAEWQTAFEIPEIARALAEQGLEHRLLEPGVENVPSSVPTYDDDEATHIGRPLSAGANNPMTGSGWTEPGRWGGDAGDAAQGYDDELTISRESAPMASPYPLTDDSRDDAQTIAREPSSPLAAPLPAAGRPPDSARPYARTSNPDVSPASKRRYVRPAQRQESERPDPAAARRAVAERSRPERARVADLFGSQAEAGGEDDPSLGRADSSPPDASGARLTGQRNETSVLFSLDALIKAESAPESKRSASPPRQELSRQRETEMLLGGSGPSSIAGLGGDFNSLIAPDLMAPARAVVEPLPRAAYGDDYVPPPPARGRALKLVLLVVVTAGIAVAATMFAPKFLAPPPAPEPAATKAEETPKPAPTEPAPTTPEAMPSASAAPPATGVGATPRPEPRPAPGPRGQAAPKPAEASPAEVPEKGLAEAMGEGAAAPPFDQGAAKTALVTAANNAASCKKEDGPTGTGRALVTFAPSGRVTKAEVTGDFAGTAVGGCVARVFRGARVPKFSGDPTTVSKNFTIQ